MLIKIFLMTVLLLNCNSINAAEKKEEIIVVSLGSHCQASTILRDLGMRSFAAPLDWLLSFDHDGVVRLINDKFQYMLDKNYLIFNSGCVINTLYNLEFHHDWKSRDLLGLLPAVADKYERRIQRFLQLPEIAERVVFIRTVFKRRYIGNYPTYRPSCLIITAQQAQALYDSLKNTFPDLKFLLAIVNFRDTDSGINENMNGIIEFKVDTLIGCVEKFTIEG